MSGLGATLASGQQGTSLYANTPPDCLGCSYMLLRSGVSSISVNLLSWRSAAEGEGIIPGPVRENKKHPWACSTRVPTLRVLTQVEYLGFRVWHSGFGVFGLGIRV